MLPQLDSTWYASQAFWMIITFCLTFLVMWKAVLPRLAAVADERRRRLDEDMQSAEKLKTEAQAVLQQYQTEMLSANGQVRAILSKAAEETAEAAKAQTAAFSEHLEKLVEQGEAELKETKERALAGVRDIAAGLVPDAVFKLSGIRPETAALENEIAEIVKERNV